jgi:hypothetical protein
VRRHYALFHAPVVVPDEVLHDGVRTVGKIGAAYLVRAGDEERAVLACHCGAVGDTNDVTIKPLCVQHKGHRVYYAGAGWMNLGAPSVTPWLLAFRAMAFDRYPNIESVSAAAEVVDRRAIVDTRDRKETLRGTAYRLQLDDIAWSAKSCAHVDNGAVCGAPNIMGGENSAALCAAHGGLRKVAEAMIGRAKADQECRAIRRGLTAAARARFLKGFLSRSWSHC